MEITIYWAFMKELPEEYQYLRKNRGKLTDGEKAIAGLAVVDGAPIIIELDNEKMQRCLAKYSRIALYSVEGQNIPVITVDSNYYNAVRLGEWLDDDFTILHQLGHYFSGHLKPETPESNAKLFEERFKAMKNKVKPSDAIEADKFAASFLGKEKALAALKASLSHLLDNNKEGVLADDEALGFSVWEYEQRIEAIRN